MIHRSLESVAFAEEWGRQMRFITGPRQSGKTTLAEAQLAKQRTPQLYYSWDQRSVRDRYKKNELFFTEDVKVGAKPQWVCFDEIHKYPKWKNVLKSIFDSSQNYYRFIVTGSAKLDLFRRAGDSLSGRYFTFHLFPLMLSEVAGPAAAAPIPASADELIKRLLSHRQAPADAVSQLLRFSGFPEPFLRQSDAFYRKWSADYADTVIKEDIGALTRIIDREYLFDLYRLLPEMSSSPLSEASLASHLELSAPTIKSYLRRLADFYLMFKIHPYSKNVKRSLLKAPKAYLFDWARHTDEGNRFENFVAVQLLARLRLWQDATGEHFELFYARTRQKEEIDFVVTRGNRPWFLIEAKFSDGPLDAGHYRLQAALGNVPLIRVCRQENVARLAGKNIFHLSASRFFQI